MKKINFLKIGIWIGVSPIFGICFLFAIFYLGRELFAIDIKIDGIGFLFLMLSFLLLILGLLFILISFFTQNENAKSIIYLLLIISSIPLILEVVKLHGNISSRGYIELVNRSGIDFNDIQIEEPDNHIIFSQLKNNKSQIIHFYPDYKTYKGKQYGGISENYILAQTSYDNYIKLKIPIIQAGEIHRIIIDKEGKLKNYHLNKITN